MRKVDYAIGFMLVISIVMASFSFTRHRIYIAGVAMGYFIGLAMTFWCLPILKSLFKPKV